MSLIATLFTRSSSMAYRRRAGLGESYRSEEPASGRDNKGFVHETLLGQGGWTPLGQVMSEYTARSPALLSSADFQQPLLPRGSKHSSHLRKPKPDGADSSFQTDNSSSAHGT